MHPSIGSIACHANVLSFSLSCILFRCDPSSSSHSTDPRRSADPRQQYGGHVGRSMPSPPPPFHAMPVSQLPPPPPPPHQLPHLTAPPNASHYPPQPPPPHHAQSPRAFRDEGIPAAPPISYAPHPTDHWAPPAPGPPPTQPWLGNGAPSWSHPVPQQPLQSPAYVGDQQSRHSGESHITSQSTS